MIAILLSTYNGERYLNNLIDSILQQSNKDWKLFIRDDGSTDDTLKIIESYTKNHQNICVIQDKISHRGCAQSFLFMLRLIDAEFYMFADQDDVWLPNKIGICLDKYNSLNSNNDKPIIIHTDLIVVDSKLKILDYSFWNFNSSIKWVGNKKILPVYNYVTGCTMFFNKAARDLCLYNNEDIVMHDSFLTLNVLFHNGEIIDIYTPTILYRQHESNVLGAIKPETLVQKSRKILKIFHNNYKQYKMLVSITDMPIIMYLKLKWQVLIY